MTSTSENNDKNHDSDVALGLLYSLNKQALTLDGHEACVTGVVLRDGVWVALISRELVIKELCDSMSEEEAEEFFDFNISCAYHGVNTPIFYSRN
jgi:hypothetical protein